MNEVNVCGPGVMTRSLPMMSERPDIEIRELADGGMELSGMVAPYGEVVELGPGISEVFMPGAFARSVAEKGSKVRLFTSHFTEASQPVGIATKLESKAKGVWGVFKVANTTAGRDARELAKSGIASGFSIGFKDVRSEPVNRAGGGVLFQRHELEVDHVILTDAPAYPTAHVTEVRTSRTPELDKWREEMRARGLNISATLSSYGEDHE